MILTILENALRIAQIVIGLGLVIFVHELGHFLMAKRHGVRVEAFSLGFGPVLWKFRRGDTEYRVSVIPLGGYVKMTGEAVGEERTGEPYELTSKTAGQRFQIFVAGALMNLLFAFPLCIFMFLVGKYDNPSEAAVLTHSLPEVQAGMKQGDRIVEVDGDPVETIEQYKLAMVKHSIGTVVPVRVRRGTEIVDLQVKQSGLKMHHPIARLTRISALREPSPAHAAGMRQADEILSVAGAPVFLMEDVQRVLDEHRGGTVEIEVRRYGEEGGASRILRFALEVPKLRIFRFPQDDHLTAPVVGRVIPETPAHGVLLEGDRILAIDGVDVPCYLEMKAVIERSAGRALKVHVRRGTEEPTFEIVPMTGSAGKGALGIEIWKGNLVAHVVEGGFYHAAGLRDGDILEEVGGPGTFIVDDLWKARGALLKVTVLRGGGHASLTLQPEEIERGDAAALGFPAEDGTILLEPSRFFRRWSLGEAVRDGLAKPVEIGVITVNILWKLITGQESSKDLSGPVGIISASYKTSEVSSGNFLWLLVMITVNLGIFNLLPVPILDGGHCLLLLIEKILGRPPSERFILRFQYTGLILLLALIVYVTVNDVTR